MNAARNHVFGARHTTRFELRSESIDPTEVSAIVSSHDGAVATFTGIVRDHNDGASVSRLEYTAYDALAKSEGELILREARDRFDVGTIVCVHRIGELRVGDLAVVVAVAAAHRGPAFDACRYVIDEVKARVPIWKKEWSDSGARWVYPKGGVRESL